MASLGYPRGPPWTAACDSNESRAAAQRRWFARWRLLVLRVASVAPRRTDDGALGRSGWRMVTSLEVAPLARSSNERPPQSVSLLRQQCASPAANCDSPRSASNSSQCQTVRSDDASAFGRAYQQAFLAEPRATTVGERPIEAGNSHDRARDRAPG